MAPWRNGRRRGFKSGLKGAESDFSREKSPSEAPEGARESIPLSPLGHVIGPREKLGKTLTDTIAAAMAAGDLRTARIAHKALAELLEVSDDSKVADLGAEREKRGGK
jgi:hypothetical protein